jgi:hypothetical protein
MDSEDTTLLGSAKSNLGDDEKAELRQLDINLNDEEI